MNLIYRVAFQSLFFMSNSQSKQKLKFIESVLEKWSTTTYAASSKGLVVNLILERQDNEHIRRNS